jgi:hypothetical protein
MTFLLAALLLGTSFEHQPLHYSSTNFTQGNRISGQLNLLPRRQQNSNGGFFGMGTFNASHVLTEGVLVQLNAPAWFDMGASPGKNKAALGNIGGSIFFSRTFSSASGLWNHRWGIGFDVKAPSSFAAPNGVPSTISFDGAVKEGFGFTPYLGWFSERDNFSLKWDLGYEILRYSAGGGSTPTAKLFKANVGAAVYMFEPFVPMLEYHLLYETESRVIGTSELIHTIEPGVQVGFDKYFVGAGLLFPVTSEHRDASFLEVTLKAGMDF